MEATEDRALKRLGKMCERIAELKAEMWEDHYDTAYNNQDPARAMYASTVATYLDIAEDAIRKAMSEYDEGVGEGYFAAE